MYENLSGVGHLTAHLHTQEAVTAAGLGGLHSLVLLREAATCQAEDDSKI